MKNIALAVILLGFYNMYGQDKINILDQNGKKHGLWKGVYDQSKRPRYEGVFEHGVETGTFTYFDDTKAKSVIATRVFSDNGTVTMTTFFDQKKNIVSEGKTVNRQNEGEWKYYHEASKDIMTIENYSKGKLTGVRKVFYKSGKIAEETTYVDGIKNGPYKSYTEKGIILEESNYKNGKYQGMAIFREPGGALSSKGPFVNNEKKGVWEYYEGGKLTKKVTEPVVTYIGIPKRKNNK